MVGRVFQALPGRTSGRVKWGEAPGTRLRADTAVTDRAATTAPTEASEMNGGMGIRGSESPRTLAYAIGTPPAGPRRLRVLRTRQMFTTYSGLGPLAIVGLLLVMLTETALKAITGDPKITAPHSWWLMTGYAVAAIYCIALHFVLKRRDAKLGDDAPGSAHRLAAIPVRYWSIIYILIGFLRVSADK